MKRNLICIICPRGCSMTVEGEKDNLTVTGNACPKGKQYAIDECTHPMRTITTTARAENGEVVPVKTSVTVPKELMFDCMKEINRATVKLPAKIGDVVITNLLGTGADVIVTANMD